MPDLPTLRSLRERVRAAKGPDRELDLSMFNAFSKSAFPYRWSTSPAFQGSQTDIAVYDFPATLNRHAEHAIITSDPRSARNIDRFTASLDAAVALVEAKLPRWEWSCGSCSVSYDATIRQRSWFAPDRNGPDAELLDDKNRTFDDGFHGDRLDGTPALALLDSFLSALIALAEREASAEVTGKATRSAALDGIAAMVQKHGME